MKIKQLTDEQQLENLELALRLWNERVTPRQITKDLATFYDNLDCCKMCFIAHVANWAEFKTRMPMDVYVVNASEFFFGDASLMNQREATEKGPLHKVVANRLTRAIEMKREQIATLATAQA